MSPSVWIVALVVAALAPTLVRLTADWLERRARARSLALLASAGVNLRDATRRPASKSEQAPITDSGGAEHARDVEAGNADVASKEQTRRAPR